MRHMLIIGELAKLLNVSTHQIRYFEEKGVLHPSQIDENGYRLYDLDAVYRLSHILLLRKLDIPVGDIKNCLKNYTQGDYLKLFAKKIEDIDNQINHLQTIKAHARRVIAEADVSSEMLNRFVVTAYPARFLRCPYRLAYEATFNLHALFNRLKGELNLFETDLISLYDERQMSVCIESDTAQENGVTLDAGDYLCYEVLLEDDYQIAGAIDQLLDYAQDNGIDVRGPVVVKERSVLSMFANQKLHYHLQILIV